MKKCQLTFGQQRSIAWKQPVEERNVDRGHSRCYPVLYAVAPLPQRVSADRIDSLLLWLTGPRGYFSLVFCSLSSTRSVCVGQAEGCEFPLKVGRVVC